MSTFVYQPNFVKENEWVNTGTQVKICNTIEFFTYLNI